MEFGLNYTKLTDDEIITKLGQAYNYLHYQTSLGHSPTVESIKTVIEALETERNNRMHKQFDEETKRKYPNINSPIDLGRIYD